MEIDQTISKSHCGCTVKHGQGGIKKNVMVDLQKFECDEITAEFQVLIDGCQKFLRNCGGQDKHGMVNVTPADITRGVIFQLKAIQGDQMKFKNFTLDVKSGNRT